MTVILSNIMENLQEISNGGHEGHNNLEATWLADITVRKNLQFDIAKCTIDSII